MEISKQYEAAILDFFESYIATYGNSESGLTHQLVIDEKRKQYLLLLIGWQADRFVYSLLFHFSVMEDKIWLQQNATDLLVIDELMKRDILKSDIILGFKPMFVNEYAGFGVV